MGIRYYSQMTTFGEELERLEEQYGDVIQLLFYRGYDEIDEIEVYTAPPGERGYDLESILLRDEEEISQILSEVSDIRLKERDPYASSVSEKIYMIYVLGDVGSFTIDLGENKMRIDDNYYTFIGSNPFLTVLERQTDWELVPE